MSNFISRSCDIMWPFSAMHCLVVWSRMILLPTFMRQFEVKHFEQVAVVTNKKYLLNVYISWSQNTNQFHNISVSDRSVVRLLPSVTLQQGGVVARSACFVSAADQRDRRRDSEGWDPWPAPWSSRCWSSPAWGPPPPPPTPSPGRTCAASRWASRVLQLWHR